MSNENKPNFRDSAQRDQLLQAAIDFIGTLTGLKPPPIEVAPPEVFAPFYAFVERVQAITRRSRAVAAQAAPAAVAVPDEDMQDLVSKALRKAWQLGQTYWQQADSEFISQQNKSGATQAKFQDLVDETRAALAATPALPATEDSSAVDLARHGMTPRDKGTQDQIAAVMLQHGTPEQQLQALATCCNVSPDSIKAMVAAAQAEVQAEPVAVSADKLASLVKELRMLAAVQDTEYPNFQIVIEEAAKVLECSTPALPATEDSSAGDLAGWAIDVSAGREILVYKNCSVIEAEQAHLVLSLIRQAEVQAEPVAPGTRLGRAEVRAGKVGYFAFEQTDLDDGDYFLYTAPQAQPADALDALTEIVGCIEAANSEGLDDALVNNTDARLADLVQRRLLPAFYTAIATQARAAMAAAQEGGNAAKEA